LLPYHNTFVRGEVTNGAGEHCVRQHGVPKSPRLCTANFDLNPGKNSIKFVQRFIWKKQESDAVAAAPIDRVEIPVDDILIVFIFSGRISLAAHLRRIIRRSENLNPESLKNLIRTIKRKTVSARLFATPGFFMRWINQTRRETKEHVAAVAVILTITVIFFWPVLRGRSFSMVGAHMFAQYPWGAVISGNPNEVRGISFAQTDHPDGLYPGSVFATNAVRSGQLPMWLPYSFNGIPIMETGVGNGYTYPPQLLAMTVLSPIRQHDLLLFSHLLLAGLGMYALLRCWSANVLGAIFGAVVWQFNGHSAFFLEFEFITVSSAWFPFMLLGATLAIRKQSWRWALATGVALGMSVLHGVQHWEYLGALVLVCWYAPLALLAARRFFLEGARRSVLFCLTLPVISAVTAAALSAAAWLSLMGLLPHVHRPLSTLDQQAGAVILLKAFIRGMFFPLSSVAPERTGPDWASLAFVGTPALVLVLAGFFRRSAPVIFATIMGLGSLGMIFGLRPLFILLRLVFPYFGALRPIDAYYVLCFAVAVLAAFGLSEISRRLDGRGVRKRLFFGLGCPLIAMECVQLILFAWITNPTHPVKPEWLFPETPMITTLKAVQGEFHVLPVSYRDPSGGWTPAVLSGMVAVNFDLRSSSGYASLLPQWTAILWRTVEKGGVVSDDLPPSYRPYFYHDRLPIHLLENLSVGFLATAPGAEPVDVNGSKPVADGSLQLLYQGPDGRIYKLKNTLPRAFLVPGVIVAPDAPAALSKLVDRKFNARDAAIVIGADTAAKTGLPTLESSASPTGATATIINDRMNDVEVGIETPSAAMLVLNDSWDSGWRAEVDGVRQPILRVNYGSRGVVVPAGKHNVKFLYRPPLVLTGLVISGVTIILLAIIFSWIGAASLVRFYRKRSGSKASSILET